MFTAGDLYSGRATVIGAVAGGRLAARSIHYLLTEGKIPIPKRLQKRINPRNILKNVQVSEPLPKVMPKELPVSLRTQSFVEEVVETISEAEVLLEAKRCLQCGTLCYDR